MLATNIVLATEFKSCKEINDYQKSLTESISLNSGIYQISPDGGALFDVYCDMETDGGGWTLVIGPGTKFGKNSDFWLGSGNSNDIFSYKGTVFNSSNSERLIANLAFSDLMFVDGSPTIYSSAEDSTFIEKRNTTALWTKKSGSLGSLVWNGKDSDGYTYSDFILGTKMGSAGYGDYYHYVIGADSNSKGHGYGTLFRWVDKETESCGKPTGDYGKGCALTSEIFSHTIGLVGHRSVSDYVDYGLFFREQLTNKFLIDEIEQLKFCRNIMERSEWKDLDTQRL
ncbi:MAG: hypothetical protein GY787_24505 [Alteromonadales bacterium]|nr:hypothetical protein [Alteromonadales bacterium]